MGAARFVKDGTIPPTKEVHSAYLLWAQRLIFTACCTRHPLTGATKLYNIPTLSTRLPGGL